MIWVLFILIWVCSCIIHIALAYFEHKRYIYRVGDLIDKIDLFMWFPLLNTFFLVALIVALILCKVFILLKIDVLWDKFKNIKLK